MIFLCFDKYFRGFRTLRCTCEREHEIVRFQSLLQHKVIATNHQFESFVRENEKNNKFAWRIDDLRKIVAVVFDLLSICLSAYIRLQSLVFFTTENEKLKSA